MVLPIFKKHKGIFTAIIMILLIITLYTFTACEPIAPIRIQNNTPEQLSIFIDDESIGDVAPGEEIRNELIIVNIRYRIEAKDEEGNLLYYKTFTLDEMVDELDWKVLIPESFE